MIKNVIHATDRDILNKIVARNCLLKYEIRNIEELILQIEFIFIG